MYYIVSVYTFLVFVKILRWKVIFKYLVYISVRVFFSLALSLKAIIIG